MIMTTKKRIGIAIFAPIGIALFIFIGGEIVLHLWNWLAPALFGWRQITFWQAVGLLALCRILFGGWGGGGHRSNRPRMGERWGGMTPEEREKFRQNWRSRCGGFAPPTGETREPASGSRSQGTGTPFSFLFF
ncbi:MAG: hypothetical protein ABSG16_00285 [Candidatus Acidiferrum sp.]|jgi:hypothetical protein